jgi:phosphatidylglycerol lysyltransferase
VGEVDPTQERSNATGAPAPSPISPEDGRESAGRPVRTRAAVWIVAATVLLNGVVGILQVLLTRFSHDGRLFGMILPLGLFHLGRTLNVTIGVMLVYLSVRLLQRRKVAWWIAVFASATAIAAHLVQFRHWYTAAAPAATLLALLAFRRSFTVRTEPRSVGFGLATLGLSVLVAITYGTLGFWLLDRRDFGIRFTVPNAVVRTLRELSLLGNSDLIPATRHARWFLSSMRVLGIVTVGIAAYSLFRPVAYRFVTLPYERARAREVVARWGRSAYDYFKTWPDKSFYFSPAGDAFVAYRVSRGVAVCLGDPVGPEDGLDPLARSFLQYCDDNGWLTAFLLPELPAMYERLGLSLIKILEGAVVPLDRFCEHTARKKYFRYIRRKLEGEGYSMHRSRPQHPRSLLDELEEVSNQWLQLPGHREWGFLQGTFSRDYLAGTTLDVLRDASGHAVAFLNEVPSGRAGEATIDMMRHRPGMHWAVMDYLFQGLMHELHGEGYQSFYLGLAAIADKPGPSFTERAVYQLSTHMNWLIHSKGVRQYKEKFEPEWEDRYLAYSGSILAVARIALALIRIL